VQFIRVGRDLEEIFAIRWKGVLDGHASACAKGRSAMWRVCEILRGIMCVAIPGAASGLPSASRRIFPAAEKVSLQPAHSDGSHRGRDGGPGLEPGKSAGQNCVLV
jgi:hypothetical protein